MLDKTTGENIKLGLDNTAQEQRKLIEKLDAQRAVEVRRGLPTAQIDRKLRSARDDLQVTEAFRDRGEIRDSTFEDNATITPWLREPISKVTKNPELVLYKLKTNAYKFSWMLIPLSVPFMWLLFPFSRRFRLYDHTVFVTYSLCFMSLLAITALALTSAGLTNVAGLLFFLPPRSLVLPTERRVWSDPRCGALAHFGASGVYEPYSYALHNHLSRAWGVRVECSPTHLESRIAAFSLR